VCRCPLLPKHCCYHHFLLILFFAVNIIAGPLPPTCIYWKQVVI
jgi:hypothetical protein